MSDKLLTWTSEKLSRLLKMRSPDEIAKYILSMENRKEIKEYLLSILDTSNHEHTNFIEDLLDKISYSNSNIISVKVKNKAAPSKQENIPKKGSKKKSKQVNLFSSDGKVRDVITLPGRHKCDCQASKHPLIRNCLTCGRIICAQEGSGPCIFCTTEIAEKKVGYGKLAEGSNASSNLESEEFLKAIAHKEKLLECDRTSERRTRVIDDESDYYNVSGMKWLAPQQREKLQNKQQDLQNKRHGSKKEMKVTLDFAGRRILEESSNCDELFTEPDYDDSISFNYGKQQPATNPTVNFPRPMYEASNKGLVVQGNIPSSKSSERLQDPELQKMSDNGKCLSMHQPYASLLVAGIKKHEGRTWYSSHRGRLWIASTVKVPSKEEVQQMENFYRVHYGQELSFPQQYPSGCLLGCVDVVDVLPQEEYRLEYPNGESESPYVFVCRDPHELLIKFPIKGHHKIYKLDPSIHQVAKKSLHF